MTRSSWRWAARLSPVALAVLWASMPTSGQGQAPAQGARRAAARPATAPPSAYGTQNGEWQAYGGDQASTRYSALDQVK